MTRRQLLAASAGAGAWALGRRAEGGGPPAVVGLETLPIGRWHRIHQQQPGDPVRFTRQAHGGSVFDSRRRRLVLFGSDSHGWDWSNNPRFFALSDLTWSVAYAPDDAASYRVNEEGLPVAGRMGDHPWAMHTFGALAYDPEKDWLYVASYPAHMVPGRFTDSLAHLWPSVRRHPTWAFSLGSGRWHALSAEAVHFFPYCTVFDHHRGALIGCRPDGVYELSGAPPVWRKTPLAGIPGYHTNAVFDDLNGVVLAFGESGDNNDVIMLDPDRSRRRVMPTRGPRPPRDQHVPLAFHSGRGELVAVVDRRTPGVDWRLRARHRAETWSYSLRNDVWTHHESTIFPFSLGMNYNLEFDPSSGCLVLVTTVPGSETSVWALRL